EALHKMHALASRRSRRWTRRTHRIGALTVPSGRSRMKMTVLAAAAAGFTLLAPFARAQEDDSTLAEITVIGSRIPRLKAEGPAPITTIDAAQIDANGLTSVPDLLKTLTQNGGETQSQQSGSGADFTPGAEQVD